ncbi:NAD(P)-dependent oxidoreductase [Saccharospirillum impatiens]|uniref:NAD(P)-dependent oxidoreductase n=1 Tax=Saccharospirillum impatiens TaxID=169438 RepID=UPI0003F8741C|nr:NAD(P)-dependent oxidoreductase [Saccharospirillum impatiens]
MAILVDMTGSESRLDAIKTDFKRLGVNDPVWVVGDDFDPATIRLVLAWKPQTRDWAAFPNVHLVQSWGAGVDHLLDAGFPADWTVARFMGQSLKDRMVRYVCAQLSNWQLDMPRLYAAQSEQRWDWHDGRWGDNVLVLGLGELGQSVAEALVQQGYQVSGWSQSPKTIESVVSLTGKQGLRAGLAKADYLINLLPLTSETRGLLDSQLWARCERKPVIMNVGRGASLAEDDLIPALDVGLIGGAILDVFDPEPLADDSPLWRHPDIWITPHIASISDPSDVIRLAIENQQRVEAGQQPRYPVDLSREY